MQTKTKYKSSNNFRAAFVFSIFICILGATINFLLFYKNFYRTLSKLNEEPIAQISFKYKTAERRFLERPIWDRLKNFSYLYNGDTVHTTSGAEATITFIDGNSMFLSESTIAQIFYTEGETGSKSASAKLSGGQLTVDSSLSQNGFSLDSAGSVLTLESGGKLSATNISSQDSTDSANSINSNSIQILSGNAKILNSDGTEQSIQEGEIFELQEENFELPLEISDEIPNLTVLSPNPNEKIISHTEENCEVLFNWKILNDKSEINENEFSGTENGMFAENSSSQAEDFSSTEFASSSSKLLLQIFSDRKMKNLLSETDVSFTDSYSAFLSSGTYYWKLTLSQTDAQSGNAENQNVKFVSGKLQIMQSLPPVLIAPKKNHLETYSTKNPYIRFVWSKSDFADYYKLEISTDENFENPVYSEIVTQTSRIVQSLGEGIYFWRVSPFFRMNSEGFAASSETGSFTIERKVELDAPNLLTPKNESFINIEKDFGNTQFSWKRDRSAFEYEFLANDSEDFSNPKIIFKTSKNFISISSSDFFTEGKWFWKVRMKDAEENFSPYSETRNFYATNGNLEIRTIEPADGFLVAETFVPDTRFTWKKNLPQDLNTKIFIATDEKMQNIVYSTDAPEFGISGIKLKAGEYFWNLGTDENSQTKISSSPKRLIVAGLLENASLIQPLGRTIVREGIPYDFEWSEVLNADFYRIDIFRSSTGELVYTNNVYGTSVSLDMFSGEGFVSNENYRYEIQARGNAIPGIQSRRSGKISEGNFNLIKLYPVEISSPVKNTRFDGVQAILNPKTLVWSSVLDVEFAQVIVTKIDEYPHEIVIKIPSDEDMQNPEGTKIALNRILLDTKDGLREGTYEIIVNAQTTEGFDISNTDERYKGRFYIGPIQPLDEVKNLVVNPKKIDLAYFMENASAEQILMKLRWDKVKDASGYELTIYETRAQDYILKFETSENLFDLDFLALAEDERRKLQNGNFKWMVEGIRRIDTDDDGIVDKILQRSKDSEPGEFEIDVPRTKNSKAKGVKNPYGEN